MSRVARGVLGAAAMTTDTGHGLIQGRPLGLASAQTAVLLGLQAHAVRIEVACTRGPALFQLVGLAEAAVREARVRVGSALAGLGVLLDEHALTVNLAPADLRKTTAALDVPIACAVLGALGELEPSALEGVLLLGELGLDGELRPVRGVLPLLIGAQAHGLTRALVPAANAREAGLVQGMRLHVARTLSDVVAHFGGERALPEAGSTPFTPELRPPAGDLADVRGQASARRALEIAAAGGHNLLFVGPPGGGKTLLARLLPTILPPLSYEEALEVTAIHSVAGLVDPTRGVVTQRPFRAPHHSVSEAGLVGGGDVPRPGEVSLAHHGVLFLDELAEFRRAALEALRQPLQDGHVTISRARARAWFPACPTLVGAVNPCPCGQLGHPRRSCRCTAAQLRAYRARLSGPLLDRIDVQVAVPPVDIPALLSATPGEASAVVRERVARARAVQLERVASGHCASGTNARLGQRDLERVAALGPSGRRLLERSATALGLSARGYVKVLRTARTIADLEGSAGLDDAHLAEAVQLRSLDRDPG